MEELMRGVGLTLADTRQFNSVCEVGHIVLEAHVDDAP
jgi:hypothetical protein